MSVSPAQLAGLPLATTSVTTPKVPQDPALFAPETGVVLHPTATQVVYVRPSASTPPP